MIISFAFHWPHNRFALGWEIIYPDEENTTTVFTLFLTILTIQVEW